MVSDSGLRRDRAFAIVRSVAHSTRNLGKGENTASLGLH